MIVGLVVPQEIEAPAELAWLGGELRSLIEGTDLSVGVYRLTCAAEYLFARFLYEGGKPAIAVFPAKRSQPIRGGGGAPSLLELLLPNAAAVRLPFRRPTREALHAANLKVMELADLLVVVCGERREEAQAIADAARKAHKHVVWLEPAHRHRRDLEPLAE
jgi:hypothetical protein